MYDVFQLHNDEYLFKCIITHLTPFCREQGHLTRFLSFGLGLSVTAIEADHNLVAMASRFDGQLLWALEKEKQKKVGELYTSLV